MDSFFEEPRPIPKPTPVIQEIQAFHVPEVSLMFQNPKPNSKCNSNVKLGKPVQSYNAWKLRTSPSNNAGYDSFLLTGINNKENRNADERSFLSKKQVRFESPKHDKVPHYPLVFQKATPPSVSPSYTLQNVENTNHNLLVDNSSKPHFGSRSQHIENKVTHYPYAFHKVTPTADVSPSHKLQNTENTHHSPKTHNIRSQNAEYPCKTLENSSQSNCQTFPKATIQFHNVDTTNNDILNDIPKSYRMPQNPHTLLGENSKQNATSNFPNSLGKMYASHMPNRELDLSFLEVANKPCYTTKMPATSLKIDRIPLKTPYLDNPRPNLGNIENLRQNFTNTDYTQQNTDITTNNKAEHSDLPQIEPINTKETITSAKQVDTTENVEIQPESIDSTKNTTEHPVSPSPSPKTPSFYDLLAIIKLQNNKLQHLEMQVAKLVELSEKTNRNIETETQTTKNVVLYKDQQVGTSFICDTENSPQKKMSVGMMTSFEVSFKKPPSTNKRHKKKHLSPVQDLSFLEKPAVYEKSRTKKRDVKRPEYRNAEPSIPIPETWRKTNETEYSLGSHESLDIQETPESPENSIHIDMQEYESDSSDGECSSYDGGWTFYKDILGQVNNILDNSSSVDCKPSNRHRNQSKPTTDTTMNKIKYAAVQRLENNGYMKSKPNEISFAVKQLLMKYMPDEELADAVHTHEKCRNKEPRRPVQTIKYLQQCNVVTQNPQYYGGKGKTLKKPNRKPSSNNDPKILDITTLRQQPKLL